MQQERLVQHEQWMTTQEALLRADTLLVEGDYANALKVYDNQPTEINDDTFSGTALRMAIAQRLLDMEQDLAQKQQHLISSDTTALSENETLAALGNNQLDSLNFALEKAKVQLSGLRKQLQSKSFGQYLSFTNDKGSQLHYVGSVKNGKANGYGVALLNTGSRYLGFWKDNQRHGEGTFYWNDGEYYQGQYKDDKRNGQGTYYWPNGEKYVGQWKEDKRSGKGAFYSKEGKLMAKGIWEGDKMVSQNLISRKEIRQQKKQGVAAL